MSIETDLLSNLLTYFDEFDTTPDCYTELPGCRYVSHCAPVVDCCDDGILAIYILSGDSDSETGCISLSDVDLVVEVWNCVPVLEGDGARWNPPSVVSQQEAALFLLNQKATVQDAVFQWLTIENDACAKLTGFRFECLDGEGGCGGYKMVFTIPL